MQVKSYVIAYKEPSGYELLYLDGQSGNFYLNYNDAKQQIDIIKTKLNDLLSPFEYKKFLWFTYKVNRPKLQEFQIRDIKYTMSTLFVKTVYI